MWSRKVSSFVLSFGILALAGRTQALENWESSSEKSKVDKILAQVDKVVAQGPFRDDWASLKNYKIPDWFQDAKFGIFIHWGLYSVPSFNNEWYSRNMYQKDSDEYKHQLATYGPLTKFGYKDFIPRFQAKNFDPKAWAKIFQRAGARYVVPVAEHHDGFAMYDSDLSRWTAKKMGPQRDVVGELAKQIRAQGLMAGASSHRAEHWWFMGGGTKFPSDVQDPKFADFYGPAMTDDSAPSEEYLRNWLARSCEIVDKVQPQILYFDWWVGEKPEFAPYLKKFMAYYYNRAAEWKKEVVLVTKDKAYVPGTSVMDVERGGLPDLNPTAWQTDTSISWGSWCYVENDHTKDAGLLLRTLIDAVSKNGNLLLNIGPKPDGTLPEEGKRVLLEMGDWLEVNGEAIYGTRPWISFGEGPTGAKAGKFNESEVKYEEGDVRFTRKGSDLYVIPMVCPTKPLTLVSLGKRAAPELTVKDAVLVGSSQTLKWTRGDKALLLPPPKSFSALPVVYKLSLGGSALGGLKIDLDGSQLTLRTTLQNYGPTQINKTAHLMVEGKLINEGIFPVEPLGAKEVTLVYQAPQAGYDRLALAVDGQAPLTGVAALPAIPLVGDWWFSRGDDTKWASPSYQDEDWQKVILPANWEAHSNYTEDNVYGWYRKTVVIPAEWKGHDLILPLGKIDDCDESYFNGVKIGKTGQFPPKFEGHWNEPRRYTVPAKLVKWGKDNVIAVKVFDATGGGGIYDGPLGPIEVK